MNPEIVQLLCLLFVYFSVIAFTKPKGSRVQQCFFYMIFTVSIIATWFSNNDFSILDFDLLHFDFDCDLFKPNTMLNSTLTNGIWQNTATLLNLVATITTISPSQSFHIQHFLKSGSGSLFWWPSPVLLDPVMLLDATFYDDDEHHAVEIKIVYPQCALNDETRLAPYNASQYQCQWTEYELQSTKIVPFFEVSVDECIFY
jgi:hypothetical protein